MNIAELKTKIFTKKTKDYTFTILFLLIFSVFILFAIRPSLTTAFSLKKEESDLAKVDKIYEDKIISIAQIQSLIEKNRSDIPLLYEAVPTLPQVNKTFNDIKTAADKNLFIIKKANIGEVNLFESNKKTTQVLKVSVDGEATFDNFLKFSQELSNQRRLKTIQKVAITRGTQEGPVTENAILKIKIDIESYYF